MYSWEIENFIKERNYYIGGDDLEYLLTPSNNPQITQMSFVQDNGCKKYVMRVNDRDVPFIFYPMPLDEALEKGLVKKRTLTKKK